MPIVDTLLPEYEREMALTRRVLERVPGDRFDWRPHPKSMALGTLVGHIAEMANWSHVLTHTEMDVATLQAPQPATTREELLGRFDANTAATRASVTGKTDGELMAVWKLVSDGETMFSMPRTMMVRSILLNHLIHHRGQLTVYLRLNDVPVPSVYGPTADEPMQP